MSRCRRCPRRFPGQLGTSLLVPAAPSAQLSQQHPWVANIEQSRASLALGHSRAQQDPCRAGQEATRAQGTISRSWHFTPLRHGKRWQHLSSVCAHQWLLCMKQAACSGDGEQRPAHGSLTPQREPGGAERRAQPCGALPWGSGRGVPRAPAHGGGCAPSQSSAGSSPPCAPLLGRWRSGGGPAAPRVRGEGRGGWRHINAQSCALPLPSPALPHQQ